jgi:rSAM/selenodomain-associated transferase 2
VNTSIIVPVLNEAEIIGPFLHHLRRCAPQSEIIVTDGGSHDETVAIAEEIADVIVRAPRGRARQMNAGAQLASGGVFWFLHADSEIRANCLPQIERGLQCAKVVGGCFRLRIPRRDWIYRISDSLGNLGVALFGFAFGDHGIFCRRDDFFAVGSYPDVPLMEDAELYRQLRSRGKMRQLRGVVATSPRRYEMLGPYRTTLFYALILVLYVLQTPVNLLARLHHRFLEYKKPEARNPITVLLGNVSSH